MSYSTLQNLTDKFGKENIKTWSDLDSEGCIDTNRCAQAIAWADAYIDVSLNAGAYALPLVPQSTAAVMTIVQDWSTDLAAHRLYFARGLLDVDKQAPKLSKLKEDVDAALAAVRNGRIRLDARRRWAPNPTAPSGF